MFTIVFLTEPARPSLDPTLIEALRSAWGGGSLAWLSSGEAAEFPVPTVPENFRQVWENLQNQGIDLNAVPSCGRRKTVLLADMDSTMIQQECIDELAIEAGVGAKVATITARAMNGEIGFEGALRERVRLLEGLDTIILETVFDNQITYTPGAKTLVATMRANGAYTALVSGGFTAFTGRVAAELGFDEHRANTLMIADGKLTGNAQEPILGREAKIATLDRILDERGLTPDTAVAVGDGANDLGMLQRAGLGVALHAKLAVQAHCDVRVNHGDLTALLYLQGYSKANFVTPTAD
jgi:phosphoserine phosphatase